MKFEEKSFWSDNSVKYVFKKGKYQHNYLVVVFSGFTTVKSKKPYLYNYMRSLQDIDCNRLFILDNHGPRGSYYMGENMTFQFEEKVISLIQTKQKEMNIKNENVICLGSSKGGSAALYYSLKYKFGYAITGAPQTKIANYILKFSRETAEYMLGSLDNQEKIQQLDNLIFESLDNNTETKIINLTSEKDAQFPTHMKPLKEKLAQHPGNHTFIIDNSIESHSGIAAAFPSFIGNKLIEIFYGINLNECNFEINDKKVIATYPTNTNKDIKLGLEFNVNNLKSIKKFGKNHVELSYRKVKKLRPNIVRTNFIITNTIGKNLLKYKLDETVLSRKVKFDGAELKVTGDELTINLNIKHSRLTYAFYIYNNNKLIEKIDYQKNNQYTYKITEKGKYKVKYFIKSGCSTLSDVSNEVTVSSI